VIVPPIVPSRPSRASVRKRAYAATGTNDGTSAEVTQAQRMSPLAPLDRGEVKTPPKHHQVTMQKRR
jgi:hypothetical protein